MSPALTRLLTRRRLFAACGLAAMGALLAACREKKPPTPATSAEATTVPADALNVRDFGAKGDGSTDDAVAIAKAIQAGIAKGPGATVFFPAGRYLLRSTQRAQIKTPYPAAAGISDGYGQPNAHVLVQAARGLTLLGEPGTVLVMTDHKAMGVLLERCADVTLRQLAVDYDPLPFTQGSIVAVDPAGGTLDLRIDAKYPDPTKEPFRSSTVSDGSVRDARTPEVLKYAGGVGGKVGLTSMAGITALAADTVRLPVAASQQRGIVVGDRFVLPARSTGNGSAVFVLFSERCTFDRVTLYASPVVAFNVQFNEALTFRECVIEPLPGSGRLMSTNADGIHCKYNRGGALVERCRFSGVHDDGFTFHSRGQQVLRVESANVLIVERNEFFRGGDEIAVIGPATGETRGTATIREAGLVRWRDRLAVRLVTDRPVAGVRAFEALGEAVLPAYPDSTTPLERRADLVADLATLGSGFIVRDSVFARVLGGSRAYSSDGKIEGNRFESMGHPLQLGVQLYWPEVYHATRVSIRNNTFVGTAADVNVEVQDRLGNFRPARTLGNRDITISGNRFEGYGPEGAIFVGNADGVAIAGNTFAGPSDVPAVTLGLARDVTVDASGAPPTLLATGVETDRGSLRLVGPVAVAHRASAEFGPRQGEAGWRYRS